MFADDVSAHVLVPEQESAVKKIRKEEKRHRKCFPKAKKRSERSETEGFLVGIVW
jgi:hypothetical protein